MNGPLLQLLVLVILLLTEPHQSASSTMVISTVCVCDLSLICEKCVCDMQCVSYVCDECGSSPFISSLINTLLLK